MRPILLLSVLVVAWLHTSSAMFPLPAAELATIMAGQPPVTNWLLTSLTRGANGLTSAQRTAWAKIGEFGRALHPLQHPAPTPQPQPADVRGPALVQALTHVLPCSFNPCSHPPPFKPCRSQGVDSAHLPRPRLC